MTKYYIQSRRREANFITTCVGTAFYKHDVEGKLECWVEVEKGRRRRGRRKRG
jgi:hypothetical protein